MGPLLVCCGLLGGGLAHAAGDHDQGEGRGRRDQSPSLREVQREVQREAPVVREAPRPVAAPQALPQAMPQRAPDQRQIDPRSFEARADEQRRAMQDSSRNAEMNRRVGRLTPDERRDLRRQINEVGQDIYANPPRH